MQNVRRAIEAGHALADAGFAPFIPHLTHYWDEMFPREYESWMAMDFAFLSVCDGVLRLEGFSPGADREVAFAKELGIPVFHAGVVEAVIHFEQKGGVA